MPNLTYALVSHRVFKRFGYSPRLDIYSIAQMWITNKKTQSCVSIFYLQKGVTCLGRFSLKSRSLGTIVSSVNEQLHAHPAMPSTSVPLTSESSATVEFPKVWALLRVLVSFMTRCEVPMFILCNWFFPMLSLDVLATCLARIIYCISAKSVTSRHLSSSGYPLGVSSYVQKRVLLFAAEYTRYQCQIHVHFSFTDCLTS